MSSPHLLFFVAEDWSFCSHRLPLAVAARDAGYKVSVVAREREHGEVIRQAGLRLIPLEMVRSGVNPIAEAEVIRELARIYRAERPDIVHHVALKPVIYGSIAASMAKVPLVVNAMVGLGFLFVSNSAKARLIRPLVKSLFRHLLNRGQSRLILQNPDDVRLFTCGGMVEARRVVLIRGSGVDPARFAFLSEPEGEPLVILASRLLWDKGVGEFVEAARLLRRQGLKARFALVGDGDDENPASISHAKLSAWHEEGVVEWWGRRSDMPKVMAGANIVCLPSYGEGVPKVLIEAAACGRAIVTTDVPGCREIVREGENGLLAQVRDHATLATALKKLIDSPELRSKMGRRGRELVEAEFSLEQINRETLALYRDLLGREPVRSANN